MKTVIRLVITSFIGTGAFLAALSMSNPYPAYAVGFGIWILFFWSVSRRSQEASRRRERERMFDEWLRSQNRDRRSY